jgi:hypothetical protein
MAAFYERPLPIRPLSRSRRVIARHNRIFAPIALENDCNHSLSELSRSFSTNPFAPSFHGYARQPLSPTHGNSIMASKLRDNVSLACRRFIARRQLREIRPSVPPGTNGRRSRESGRNGTIIASGGGAKQSTTAAHSPMHDFNYSSASCLAVPLTADRASVPDVAGTAQLYDLLPSDMAARYATPTLLLRPQAEVIAAPHAVMCASRADYIGVIRRLTGIGMIAWTQSPRAVNGLFGVPKEPGKPNSQLRLIIDARPANAMFIDPPHCELPTPDVIGRLSVPRDQTLYIAKADISDFYHRLLMPPSWWRYFALPAMTAAEAKAGGIVIRPIDGERLGDVRERWWPCIRTLPMGFSHAVPLAQALHEHFITTHVNGPQFDREERISSASSLHIGSVRWCTYIDDLTLLGSDPVAMERMLSRYISAAWACGLDPKHSKTLLPCTRAEVVGLEIDGVEQTVGVSPTKLQRLCDDTRALLTRGIATTDDMRRIVGRWTWAMLIRRPSLAIFSSVYRYMECARRVPFAIWPTVHRELTAAVGLAPLLFTSLSDTWCPHVIATDASMTGQGVVITATSPAVMAAVAAHRSMPGDTNGGCWRPIGGQLADDCPTGDQLAGNWRPIGAQLAGNCPIGDQLAGNWRPIAGQLASNCEIDGKLPLPLSNSEFKRMSVPYIHARPPPPAELHNSRWTEVISSRWDREEHINSLEMRACYTAIRWSLARSSSDGTAINSRLLILSDSSTAIGALSKGRSSSPVVLRRCRTVAAFLLASGLRLHLRWVPTEWNPADGPSRA